MIRLSKKDFIYTMLNIDGAGFLNKDNILFKKVGDKVIGKRSVFTNEYKNVWLEEARDFKEIKYWRDVTIKNANEIFEL